MASLADEAAAESGQFCSSLFSPFTKVDKGFSLPLDPASGNACDDLFRQKDIQDKGRQKHDHHGCEHASPVPGVFHGVNHGIQAHGNRAQLVGVGKYLGDKVLIPDIDKVKYGDSDDSRLSHRKHDQPEGFGGRAAVNSCCLLKGPGQIAKKGHEKYGGIRHIDADV